MAQDTEYRDNQRDSQKEWRQRNPDYYRHYRSGHPVYVQRNLALQKGRDAAKRAKHLAKMDAWPQKVLLIPIGSDEEGSLAKKDSMDMGLGHFVA